MDVKRFMMHFYFILAMSFSIAASSVREITVIFNYLYQSHYHRIIILLLIYILFMEVGYLLSILTNYRSRFRRLYFDNTRYTRSLIFYLSHSTIDSVSRFIV